MFWFAEIFVLTTKKIAKHLSNAENLEILCKDLWHFSEKILFRPHVVF